MCTLELDERNKGSVKIKDVIFILIMHNPGGKLLLNLKQALPVLKNTILMAILL